MLNLIGGEDQLLITTKQQQLDPKAALKMQLS